MLSLSTFYRRAVKAYTACDKNCDIHLQISFLPSQLYLLISYDLVILYKTALILVIAAFLVYLNACSSFKRLINQSESN